VVGGVRGLGSAIIGAAGEGVGVSVACPFAALRVSVACLSWGEVGGVKGLGSHEAGEGEVGIKLGGGAAAGGELKLG